MKLTKSQLRKIIKEEVSKALSALDEVLPPGMSAAKTGPGSLSQKKQDEARSLYQDIANNEKLSPEARKEAQDQLDRENAILTVGAARKLGLKSGHLKSPY
tara:strand:- start:33501 stop:33803 length:303 start_codon:yes stop_codon:yes gene_type:complete